ncbi:ABC transporter substrate-binding protein [Natronorubrum thiooxidans]|uniref:ABC-type nitrate/sulfonate/bicarbonate transport system, substrate-binding protein n=1 Tax=Natronorubrum thiooxidans TaxID=308853 RepID=A0A1N7D9F8_9EURY|nr:ABC transporter substrate-binding protein [Natronorubrum thiooxidans]SIR72375.1 ABC-type nitrate/sulfonate/bicarbonate transport system, substrate-binding protein [Natronorubrum thiooxidans]
MHARSYWVLDDDDAPVVDRIAAGLGRSPARVLAYLLLRDRRVEQPATSTHLQVGTQSNRTTINDATTTLEERELVDRSSVRADDPGRPQTAWGPIDDLEATIERTYRTHASALIDHALECHDRHEREDTRRSRSEAEATPSHTLEVALNWRPNALHVPIHAAIAAEWYAAFDVDVRLDHHDGSRRALERVRSGVADVAVVGAATVARARAAGEPIVPVALLYQRAMTVLYTIRSVFGEPLESVGQLEGRRVGMPPDSEMRLLGRLFLSQTGFDDVGIVDTNGEERAALSHGTADVVTGSFSDPDALERRDRTVDTIRLADHFPVAGPALVVHESTLEAQRAPLEGFLAGTTGGWAQARRDPAPAVDRLAATSDDSPERIRQTFDRAVSAFGESEAVREHGWGWQRRAAWDRLRTALEHGGLLPDPA